MLVGALIPDSLHAFAGDYLHPRGVSYIPRAIRVLIKYCSYILVESQIRHPSYHILSQPACQLLRFRFGHGHSCGTLVLCTIFSDRGDVAVLGVKHVSVIWFAFHVVQLLSRRFT